MAYLWGKYERRANYRTEKRLARNAFATQGFATARHDNGDIKLYPDLAVSKRTRDLVRGDIVYVDKVDTRGSIPDAHVVNEVTSEVAKIINLTTMDTYYCDYRCDFYKIEEIRVLAGYSQGSYITDVESISRSEYPDNGEKGGYFYVYKGLKEVKAPRSIEYERMAQGGDTLDIRWTPSDDANVYVLEKGTTLKPVTPTNFKRIYQGRDTSYRDTLEVRNQGEWQVIYRVKAVARDGDESEWTEGSYCFVDINSTPTISGWDEDLGSKKAPFKKTFTVDDSDKNQELNVTVRLNGQNIKTIRNATRKETYEIDIDEEKFNNLTLNERNTIEITVEDKEGASAIRRYYFTKSNTNPTVSVQSSNMGEQNKPFSIKFTPDDADGDMITCKIFVGETQIADLGSVTAKRLQTYTFKKLDFAKLPNGEHKIRIEVKDTNGGVGYGFITFSKNVKSCWYKYKKELEGKPNQITVDVMAEVAEGAKMTIKVCNNALDYSPTWEVVEQGTAHKFSNKNKVNEHWAIGVWVTIERQKAAKASYFYGLVGHYS